MENKPHLVLIHPGPNKNRFGKKRRRKSSIAPLTLPLLAGLAAPDFRVTAYDEDIEDLPREIRADFVGITAITPQAKRAYELADSFRERGIPVIMGGLHPSFFPEEAAAHADALVIGEAEGVWPELAADMLRGTLKPRYAGQERHDLRGLPPARREILKQGGYSFPNVIMASRGCPFNCEYCSVTQYWGRTYRCRPVAEVVAELAAMPTDHLVFVDDNICGNPAYARELFRAMAPLKKNWVSQGSITLAKDPELLDLAAASGLSWLFIGIESINPKNLRDMGKRINKVDEYAASLRTFRERGVNVLGSFMLGLDHDDRDTFRHTLAFCEENHLAGANFYIFTPMPGTRSFARMEAEGRLLHRNWEKYDANHVVFRPLNMTPEELLAGFLWLYNTFYSLNSLRKRITMAQPSPLQTVALNIGRIVRRKIFIDGCRN
ncbi:MAG TPA: radical SAM protein [Syntrophales bacterium]|jgi:radical SAM superfamily enzyme YgiQ (UPF0313 family)|nr:radical SAM protein [Syntrophales bacterium]HON22725.1 radical SAM protein [Syntrophales bacterium]HOU77761.1 radical SAM protein [Syntrophales bacterium]HPC32860.1 radical SAM protein [Syntrophales bacterium]HQG34910.1 radical SAM protein [Syntrophales bacterium]